MIELGVDLGACVFWQTCGFLDRVPIDFVNILAMSGT